MNTKYTTLHWVPFWLKIVTAKALMRMLKFKHIEDDIVLFNELQAWVKSGGKPTTGEVR